MNDMFNVTCTMIRRKLSSLLVKIGHLSTRASSKIYQSPQQKRVVPWFRDHGDRTLRLDYDLNKDSVVFDLGGYEGQWASDIYAMYCCGIHVFEPVEEFAQQIEKRFSKNQKIIVHQFGLAGTSQTTTISVDRDSSSIFKPGVKLTKVKLVRAADFVQEHSIQIVDLMKINIEGGEYDLLEHLIDVGYVSKIKNIQVQFHDFVPDAERRMQKIQVSLAETHELTYQYPLIWENWRIKTTIERSA
jgi:FkbM family methyltransferase